MTNPITRLPFLNRLEDWARRTQEDACANAREAATEAARRRVERAEVDLYLTARGAGAVDRAVAPG